MDVVVDTFFNEVAATGDEGRGGLAEVAAEEEVATSPPPLPHANHKHVLHISPP